MGATRVVANFANETAFNTIFAVGIVLTAIVIALSFAIKNYVVSKEVRTKANWINFGTSLPNNNFFVLGLINTKLNLKFLSIKAWQKTSDFNDAAAFTA